MERHARRIEELRLWRNAREHEISRWRFSTGEGETEEISPGDFWPDRALPVYLETEVEVPEGWAGQPVELELWLGGEGFVRLSNGITGGLNPFHRSYPVAEEARGGEALEIEAEVVSKGMFGADVSEPRLTHAALVVPETGVRALERDLTAIHETCAFLDDHEVVPPLLDALDAAFALLSKHWPTGTDAAISRHLRRYDNPFGSGLVNVSPFLVGDALDVNMIGREIWSSPSETPPLQPLPDSSRRAVEEARELVAGSLEKLKHQHPPPGSLALTGHAHLDLAWLWPVAETRRKARRTFSSVLGLMDRYEDFTFNQSSAALYEWVEEDDPELFEAVRQRISEGRWEAVGGMWVEPDCQIPGGESFVRQLLYGQRYFEEKFGQRSTVAWLPDAFGFSSGIPQLLRGAGITGFFTYKLNWNATNEFPHDLYEWEGVDGSRVAAHTFDNPGMDYNGNLTPRDLLGTWRNYGGKRRHPESLFSFGWGDGGGGPSEQMLENYARLKDFPALPRLRMARVDQFFAALPEEGLPRWVGELYLELHRGTFTTQGRVKKLNREAEHRLLEAEAFATIASLRGAEYPSEKLERAWKALLLNQFHDILPGTSIAEVYEETIPQLEAVVETAREVRDAALGNRPDPSDTVVVVNAALRPRPLTVVLPDTDTTNVADAGGGPLPVQRTDEGLLVHAPEHRVPGLGHVTLMVDGGGEHRAASSGIRAEPSGGGAVIENDHLRVEVGADGTLHRVYDKEARREALSERANQLWAYTDKPPHWDAWDVDEDYELEGEELPDAESVEVVEDGPLRGAVRVVRSWRDSRIVQTYRLLSGSRRLDVETAVDWRERQVLLRALFPVNVRSHEATFETMYGVVKRPTHRNTSWDAARFEVCGHRFADLSEPGYGVALLNDGKYGHSVRNDVLGLSLLRGPLYPDLRADEGEHRFTYSLFPHPGGWIEAGVVDEAFDLNSPLFVTAGSPEGVESGFVEAEGTKLDLGGLKRAEDGRGVVLRLYEPHGSRGECVLRFKRDVQRAEKINLLEEPEAEIEADGVAVRFRIRPFEVVSLRVKFRDG